MPFTFITTDDRLRTSCYSLQRHLPRWVEYRVPNPNRASPLEDHHFDYAWIWFPWRVAILFHRSPCRQEAATKRRIQLRFAHDRPIYGRLAGSAQHAFAGG